ncbi:MAG TPA: cell surface protein SprA, partial [Porphyromonadaceae bacterium]|nr:cell surface protein SprA [Porphyromonadaceae bacterium]
MVEDLTKKLPADLQTPSNIRTEVFYDYKTNRYVFQNKVGDKVTGIPFTMTPAEYMEYTLKESNDKYFKDRNAIRKEDKPAGKEPLPFFNLRRSNTLLEDVFGPGGIQLTTQGSIELSSGLIRNVIDNPTLPERSRKRTRFDLDPQIQLNVNAKVGNKINFGLNYNTNAAFNFDARRVKLAYQGDEDEIIKNIEAGNVSMTTENSLINGGMALFGIKSDLQFGKLRVSTVLSQQESESRTISSRGAVQTTPFEINADQYDENRHFFLSHYFRDNYDKALAKLPYVRSAVSITRLEVWVTNKRSSYDQARDILALADLGEHSSIHNPLWSPTGVDTVPHNDANTMYRQLISTYVAARDISQTTAVFPSTVIIGRDYEKIESARLLTPSEYTFQPQLGYVSLRTPLQADEVLAVAYEYIYNGKAYQVGEFSSNQNVGALFLKLLKPVSLSPQAYTWDLMMKNIYSLGYNAYNIQKDRFKL